METQKKNLKKMQEIKDGDQLIYTSKLTEYCSNLKFDDLSNDVIEHLKYLMIDFLGLSIKGLALASTKQVHSLIQRTGGSGESVILGTSLKASPQYAALANGTASHSLSLDDIYIPASIHPGSTIFSSALSCAENEKADGRTFIESVVAGYEVVLRLADAIVAKDHYAKGWHPTATCGTFGATAAVSKILRLDKNMTESALGIAGSMTGGLMAFLNEGSLTKRIHAGLAAQRGVQAAYLAAEGFMGPKGIFECKWGFLYATSLKPQIEKLVKGLGTNLRIKETGLKLHACCRYNQAAIDAAIYLRTNHKIDLNDIRKISIKTFQQAFPFVVEPLSIKQNPQTEVQAQFSLPYTVAMAFIRGRVSFEDFDQSSLLLPELKKLIKKIEVVHHPEYDTQYPEKWPASVSVELFSDEKHYKEIDYPKGDIKNKLDYRDLISRFEENTSSILNKNQKNKIITSVEKLEDLHDIRELTNLFQLNSK